MAETKCPDCKKPMKEFELNDYQKSVNPGCTLGLICSDEYCSHWWAIESTAKSKKKAAP